MRVITLLLRRHIDRVALALGAHQLRVAACELDLVGRQFVATGELRVRVRCILPDEVTGRRRLLVPSR